jgi:hypothetical protein
MGLFSVAGAKAFIGGVLSMGAGDMSAADFSSQEWVEITGLIAMGSLGAGADVTSSEVIDIDNPHAPGRVRKTKGAIDGGTMQIIAAADYEAAGQIAVVAAVETSLTYAFKIEMADKPSGGSRPSRRLFVALVVSAEDILDSANDVHRFSMSLAVDSNIVRVAAA